MHCFIRLCVVWLLATYAYAATERSSASRSPENQMFQFMQKGSFEFPGQIRREATAYLWIPPDCSRVRGLLVAGRNLTEHWLVGHPLVREACAAEGLGIVWCVPTLFDPKVEDGKPVGVFLQRLLDGLAKSSGYEEVATVPWLPLGESGHLLFVIRLVNVYPERCIAGIEIKNAHFGFKSRGVPILMTHGAAQEWDQDKKDLARSWQSLGFYEELLAQRKSEPAWPVSLLVEGGSGHFDCTEAMAAQIARYIRLVCQARLPSAGRGGDALRELDLNKGFVAGLPLPGRKSVQPKRYADCSDAEKSLPWFFDADSARAAYDMADIDWNARLQMPAILGPKGEPVPFAFRGVMRPVPFVTEADGESFSLEPGFLNTLPEKFKDPGTPLGHSKSLPTIEWISGQVTPLGENRFRISLERTWPDNWTWIAVRHPGDATFRAAV